MTLNEYQEKAMITCMASCRNFSYMMLNLVGEVGEFASKVAKRIRRDEISVIENRITLKNVSTDFDDETTLKEEFDREEANDKALMLEAGDILWQLAGLCKVKGWSLEEVAAANLDKLKSRQKRGVIDGEGDIR